MHASNDDPDDPGDPTADDPASRPTPDCDADRRPADRPLCRVFGGPTSHRVQFAGPESRPATGLDRATNERQPDEPCRDADRRRAGGRAIAAVLDRRQAGLERALDPVREACWRGDSLDVADLRDLRVRLDELQVAVEEYLARACPDADPWESAGEHVPEGRLVELLERGGGVTCADEERADREESGES